jgi:NADH dehydrogenase FAD-containing subunit
MSPTTTPTTNVVIVGAGVSARMLIKFLRASKDGKSSLNITVIQPNKFASLPFYQTLVLTKRDTLANNTTFVEIDGVDKTVYGVAVGCGDGVVAVRSLNEAGEVDESADGTVFEVKFDVLVAATGFSFPTLTSSPGQSREDREKEIAMVGDAVTSGKQVVIAGGGSTGVELAGDVLETLPVESRKGKVTLVCSSDHLLPDQDPKRGAKCREVLEELGCTIIFNDRISSHDKTIVAGPGEASVTLTLKSGKTLDCQAYVAAYSRGPNSAWLTQPAGDKSLPKKVVNEKGKVEVNDHLQSTVYSKLYATGAVNSRKEPALVGNCENHAKTVAANILKPESVKVTDGTIMEHAPGQFVGRDTFGMIMPENLPLPGPCATICCDWCGFPCNFLCPCFLCAVLCGPADPMACGWCCGGPPAGPGMARTGANIKKMNIFGQMAGFNDLGEPIKGEAMKR